MRRTNPMPTISPRDCVSNVSLNEDFARQLYLNPLSAKIVASLLGRFVDRLGVICTVCRKRRNWIRNLLQQGLDRSRVMGPTRIGPAWDVGHRWEIKWSLACHAIEVHVAVIRGGFPPKRSIFAALAR